MLANILWRPIKLTVVACFRKETFWLRDRFWLSSVREKWQWTDLWMPLNSVRSWVDLEKSKRSWKRQWLSQHNRRKTNGVFRCRLPRGWPQSYGRTYLFTGNQKHPFESRGIKWNLNGIDTTKLCKNNKNCSLSWFVGKKHSGTVLLIHTFSLSVLSREAWLVYPSRNNFYLDMCETKGRSLAVFKFRPYFYHTFWLVEFYIRFC